MVEVRFRTRIQHRKYKKKFKNGTVKEYWSWYVYIPSRYIRDKLIDPSKEVIVIIKQENAKQ